MQGHTTLSTGTEDDLNSINKGAELMMRRNSKSGKPELDLSLYNKEFGQKCMEYISVNLDREREVFKRNLKYVLN